MVVVLPEPLTPATRMTNGRAVISSGLATGDEHLLDLAGEHRLHLVRRDAFLEAAFAQHLRQCARRIRAPRSARINSLSSSSIVVGVELALGHQVGDRRRRATTRCA